MFPDRLPDLVSKYVLLLSVAMFDQMSPTNTTTSHGAQEAVAAEWGGEVCSEDFVGENDHAEPVFGQSQHS